MSIGAPGAWGTGGGPSVKTKHDDSYTSLMHWGYHSETDVCVIWDCQRWIMLIWTFKGHQKNHIRLSIKPWKSSQLFTINVDVSPVDRITSLCHHAEGVKTLIILSELSKCELGNTSPRLHFHPLRLFQEMLWRAKKTTWGIRGEKMKLLLL